MRRNWRLRTKDGDQIYRDPNGDYTLENADPDNGVEFREGEHPEGLKEEWAKKASDALGVECEWELGLPWTAFGDLWRIRSHLPPINHVRQMPKQPENEEPR